jgi:hypothetical protein
MWRTNPLDLSATAQTLKRCQQWCEKQGKSARVARRLPIGRPAGTKAWKAGFTEDLGPAGPDALCIKANALAERMSQEKYCFSPAFL